MLRQIVRRRPRLRTTSVTRIGRRPDEMFEWMHRAIKRKSAYRDGGSEALKYVGAHLALVFERRIGRASRHGEHKTKSDLLGSRAPALLVTSYTCARPSCGASQVEAEDRTLGGTAVRAVLPVPSAVPNPKWSGVQRSMFNVDGSTRILFVTALSTSNSTLRPQPEASGSMPNL